MVGFETGDDAAVYKVDDHTALVQTVDIFPPVTDDPFLYGQIAAANSLSDVYAMGGTPKLAMNILCIPEDLDKEIIKEILRGGYSKVREASGIVCGGHTIKDNEPKYGLSVTGFVHPDRILKNAGAKEGDILILTKALGTGILNTALKGDLLEKSTVSKLCDSMTSLNKYAAEQFSDFPISSCTDITGFGLLGHSFEMASASEKTIVLESSALPLLPQALEMAEMGIVPQGAYNNRNWLGCSALFSENVSLALSDIMFDPQTSGGLLVAISEKEGLKLAKRLADHTPVSAVIGYVDTFSGSYLKIK